MIVSNLQSLRPLVAVVSLKRATIRPHPGALGPISTRPTGPAVVCRMRMPKWAAQRRSHAATRQTDARLTPTLNGSWTWVRVTWCDPPSAAARLEIGGDTRSRLGGRTVRHAYQRREGSSERAVDTRERHS